MVLATQNPIEQEGTYPLPEAQLDRFLLKMRIGYPSLRRREAHGRRGQPGPQGGATSTCRRCSAWSARSVIVAMQRGTAAVTRRRRGARLRGAASSRATRDWAGIALGAGPRGASRWCAPRARGGARRAATSSRPTTCARSPCRRCATASRWRRSCRSKASARRRAARAAGQGGSAAQVSRAPLPRACAVDRERSRLPRPAPRAARPAWSRGRAAAAWRSRSAACRCWRWSRRWAGACCC